MTGRGVRAFRHNRRGSVAMELAIMAPVVCALLFGAWDIGQGFAMKLALEQAAGRTAELATAPGTVAPTYANLTQEVIDAYGKPYSSVAVDNWLECGGTRQANFDDICAEGVQRARYVSIRIDAEFVPYFNYGGLLRGNGPNGGFVTRGDAVVRIQ